MSRWKRSHAQSCQSGTAAPWRWESKSKPSRNQSKSKACQHVSIISWVAVIVIQIWVLIDLICAYSASCSGTLLASGTISRSVAREWAKRNRSIGLLNPIACHRSVRFRPYYIGFIYSRSIKQMETSSDSLPSTIVRVASLQYTSFPSGAVHWESAPTVQSHLFACSFPIGNWDIVMFLSIYICGCVVSLGIFVLSDSLCFLNPLSFVHLTYTLYSNHISILIQQLPHSKGLPRSPLDSKNEAALPHRCVPQLSVSMACHVSSSVKAHSSRMQADYRLHCNLGRSFRLAFRVIPCHFFGILKDSAHQSHLQTLQPFSHSRFCLLKFGNVEEINDSHSHQYIIQYIMKEYKSIESIKETKITWWNVSSFSSFFFESKAPAA